jgi:hypothetical protein
MKKKSIPEAASDLYNLLEPLEVAERSRVIQAALAMLGENSLTSSPLNSKQLKDEVIGQSLSKPVGPKAERWIRQFKVDRSALDELYHIDDTTVDLISTDVPGKSTREKTVNCYLLVGIRNFLANDEPKFDDKEAVDFCQSVGAYDRNNHTSNRNSLGNLVSGNRANGFTLTIPGQREAAQLVRTMTNREEIH